MKILQKHKKITDNQSNSEQKEKFRVLTKADVKL